MWGIVNKKTNYLYNRQLGLKKLIIMDMNKSEPQKNQILNEIRLGTASINAMITTMETCRKRILFLREKGIYLETIFVSAQIVEHYLKLLIEGYASRRRILHLLGERDIFESINLSYKDEAPLGDLINTLNHLQIDRDLLRKLWSFNAMRKEAVHHIFDGKREVEKFEKEVNDYLGSDEFFNILNEILTIQQKIGDEIFKLAE